MLLLFRFWLFLFSTSQEKGNKRFAPKGKKMSVIEKPYIWGGYYS
ncbi:hypothetical protein HMPREF1990_01555 [Porphyromonas gingivalis W4087]|nr:hypothetical protein HMPREF1554_01369 [Porphyromonas gingivalis F0569]ERJ88025.1 hypothetical protein HMPREF1990_01555 [Porphyromonas gingivalis W4087]